MKKHLSTILLCLVFLVGLSLLLYPTVSDYINSLHQSRAIAQYADEISHLDSEKFEQLRQEAIDYNAWLVKRCNLAELSEEELETYHNTLKIDDNGIMSYIEIPKINCYLPIYHGTSEGVLQNSIGHLEGTSLPIDGGSTHCVLSGHRGLPSAKLFSELDRLVEGDRFSIRTLDEVLTYEVDQILIVLPHEVEALAIEPGRDLCTLVTCTPYGVNSHRMLVRGHRVENEEEETTVRVVADAIQIEPVIVAPIIAVPMLLILLIWVMVGGRKKKK